MLSAEGTTTTIASFRQYVTWRSGIAFAGIEPLPYGPNCPVLLPGLDGDLIVGTDAHRQQYRPAADMTILHIDLLGN